MPLSHPKDRARIAPTIMRLAIISDTHLPRGARKLPEACVVRLSSANMILHAGDIQTQAFLDELREIGPPVHAVYGNVDEPTLRRQLPSTLELAIEDTRIAMTHDAGPARGRLRQLRVRFPDADVVVFGHSRRLRCHRRDARVLRGRRRSGVYPFLSSRQWSVCPIGGDWPLLERLRWPQGAVTSYQVYDQSERRLERFERTWYAATAQVAVPKSPGLYAIYGPPSTWNQLKLGDPTNDRPLYVGKSESNLADRDVKTHFGDGRTGSSTVRRSFAALLRDSLGLHALPRNPAKPADFDRYSLSPMDDAQLTAWMREHLTITVWPHHCNPGPLKEIEKHILKAWGPPLNLTHVVPTHSTVLVKAARRMMAQEARRA